MTKKKEVKFKLEEIPTGGYLIKDDYAIHKSINGDIGIAKIETVKKKDNKTLFDAFTKGFHDGMFTIISVFDIPKEKIKEGLHSMGLINARISELYHLWMGF